MATQESVKLYANAMRKGAVQRYGKIVMVVMSGEGAVLIPALDWAAAHKWAMSKNATGAPMRDRQILFERIEVLVARPGSFIATKGNNKALGEIVKGMKECGLDPKEWVLPPELKDEHKPEPPKKAAEVEADLAEPAPAVVAQVAPAATPTETQGFWVREKKP